MLMPEMFDMADEEKQSEQPQEEHQPLASARGDGASAMTDGAGDGGAKLLNGEGEKQALREEQIIGPTEFGLNRAAGWA
jgi:hypothetical protein